MLYIFYMDCGWQGSIVVVAKTEEEARKLMKPHYNYDSATPIECHEIKEGLSLVNLGDC